MTPEAVFEAANILALAGWLVLAAGVASNRPLLRDRLAGTAVPLALSLGYVLLILRFWWTAEGGFGSLADVQQLFGQPWVALAGWVHYLAFDLAIGAAIAARVTERGLPRFVLVVILPLTFLFGPAGFLVSQAVQIAHKGPQS